MLISFSSLRSPCGLLFFELCDTLFHVVTCLIVARRPASAILHGLHQRMETGSPFAHTVAGHSRTWPGKPNQSPNQGAAIVSFNVSFNVIHRQASKLMTVQSNLSQVSFGAIYASFGHYGDTRSKVFANRGWLSDKLIQNALEIIENMFLNQRIIGPVAGQTMIQTATRRPPH